MSIAKQTTAAAVLCIAALGAPTEAPANVISGALTATDPTYNRVFSCAGLSGAGTHVYYDVFSLAVSLTGGYDVGVTSGNDSFLTIYNGSFNPNSPLTNCVTSNDDAGPGLDALITNATLTAGIEYFAVVTSFGNGNTFSYELSALANASNTTGGVATLSNPNVVPIPGSLALIGLGLASLGAVRRKRT